MTLQQLYYVLAVEREGSFRAAAESCYVTQPTLSMQVQKLEEWLGVKLFDRSQHPIVATPIGRQVLNQARIVVKEAEKIRVLIEEEQGGISGEFRLAVIPTLAPYVLPLFLQSFLQAYPDVQLSIQELQTHEIIDQLKRDAIDAGLLVTPLQMKEIRERPLFYEPFYLYASEGHPILKRKKISDEHLASSEIFLLSEGHCFRDQVLSLCHKAVGAKTKSLSFDSGSLATVKKLVDQGSGYTLLPQLAADDLLHGSEKKRLKPFREPVPYREVSLVYHQHFAKTKFLEALAAKILDCLPGDLREQRPAGKRAIVPIDAPVGS